MHHNLISFGEINMGLAIKINVSWQAGEQGKERLPHESHIRIHVRCLGKARVV